jgi:hypothetical protein
MRSLILKPAIGFLVLAVVSWGPQAAQGQIYFGQPYYGQSYYQPPNLYMPAPSFYYAPPAYYTPPVYYPQPYVWSKRYYSTPMYSGWYRDRYYPWTNSYFFQYRNVPNYPVPWWYTGPR